MNDAADRFQLGRPRPAHAPRVLRCGQCGASLELQDERAQLVVCSSCGAHLDPSAEEAVVLGSGGDRGWADHFRLQLGDSVRLEGVRREVVARLAYLEDGEADELNRHYLLYHPSRGSLWLADYRDAYDVGRGAHVMPESDPFGGRPGDRVRTYDDREWLLQETATYQLAYVDGALPWVARIGDTIEVAELVAADGSGLIYEVERTSGDEMEYALGRRVPFEEMQAATPDRELPGSAAPVADIASRLRSVRWLLAVAAATVLINGLGWLYAMLAGHTVLEQSFSAQELSGEVLSQPFEISKAEAVVEIRAKVPNLDNAWLALDVAVVEGEDQVVHVWDGDVEYYHGSEGGESWSEGGRSTKTRVRVPRAGTHRLLLHAVSAQGDTESAEQAQHDVQVRVIEGAMGPGCFGCMSIVGLVFLVVAGLAWAAIRGYITSADEEED